MSPLRRTNHRFLLPDVINPTQRCLSINIPQDVAHERAFFAALQELSFPWVWQLGNIGEQKATADVWQEILRDASYSYYFENGGCMFELRQNAENNCQLEQSADGGATWSLAFDYSLCNNVASLVAINNESNTYIDNTNITYAGSITNVYPGWDYATGDNADQDAALCFALAQYVDYISDTMIALIDLEVSDAANMFNSFAIAEVTVGSVFLALAGIATFPVSAFATGTALLAASLVTLYFANTLTNADIIKLQDADARAEVVCLMYGNIFGATPSFTAWETSVDGALTGNAEFIREIVAQYNDDESMFVQWVGLMTGAIAAASAGLITNNCTEDCDDTTWCYYFDFTINDGGWQVMSQMFNRPYGVYAPGFGWQNTYKADTDAEAIYIEHPWAGTRVVTDLRLDFVVTGTVAANREASMYLYDVGVETLFTEDTAYTTGTPQQLTWTGSALSDNLGCVLVPGSGTGSGTTTLTITGVRIAGTGTNPFGADNC